MKSHLSLDEKASTAGPGLPTGECEVLRRDSGKAELPVLYPDKEVDGTASPWLRPLSVPEPIGEYTAP